MLTGATVVAPVSILAEEKRPYAGVARLTGT